MDRKATRNLSDKCFVVAVVIVSFYVTNRFLAIAIKLTVQ